LDSLLIFKSNKSFAKASSCKLFHVLDKLSYYAAYTLNTFWEIFYNIINSQYDAIFRLLVKESNVCMSQQYFNTAFALECTKQVTGMNIINIKIHLAFNKMNTDTVGIIQTLH